MLAATFDIGTTAVKAVVVNENGEPVFTGSSVIHTIETGNFKEQDPDEWYGSFFKLSKEMFEIIPLKEIGAIIFSGQMQDVISVGAEGKALRNAILYSDGRADEQARMIIREAASRNVVPLGDAYIAEITGNHFDGSMPLAKILWLKENEPEIYEKTACFLISSKDYIIGRLTSVFAGDMTACSTAGAMDLDKKIWSEELIGAAGVDIKKFFTPMSMSARSRRPERRRVVIRQEQRSMPEPGMREQRHLPAASWHRGSTTSTSEPPAGWQPYPTEGWRVKAADSIWRRCRRTCSSM